MNPTTLPTYMADVNAEYAQLREKQTKKVNLLSLDEAKKRKPNLF
jgi:hypothetical protein